MIVLLSQRDARAVWLDASPSRTPVADVEVTEHPVESGANVVDHVRPKARELKLDALLVDVPLRPLKPGEPAAGAGRARALLAVLEKWRDAGELLDIEAPGEAWRGYVIASLQATTTKDVSASVRFTLSLRQIRVVRSSVVALQRTTVRKAQAVVAAGKQAGEEPTSAERSKSLLVKLIDSDLGGQIQQRILGR